MESVLDSTGYKVPLRLVHDLRKGLTGYSKCRLAQLDLSAPRLWHPQSQLRSSF